MTSELFRLTYVSRSLLAGERCTLQQEVARILEVSRRNNSQADVTGALLFSLDCFAQTLEGRFDAVQTAFERIQRDARHRDTTVLAAGPAQHREFADWSMAYAGHIEDDRVRFATLTGLDAAKDRPTPAGADSVLALLRGVVQRATPALA